MNEAKVGFVEHRMTLHQLLMSPPLWQWKREDGAIVSPTFNTQEAAVYFSGRMPMLTDAEWKERHPLPPKG